MAQPQSVESTVFPYLTVRLQLRGHSREALALSDTGFTGDLAIPTASVSAKLGLPDARIDWQLADGRTIDAPVYLAVVEIVGLPPMPAAITVLGDEYIMGRGVLDKFRITLDRGRRVVAEA
jgi:predicted aspartyl protease